MNWTRELDPEILRLSKPFIMFLPKNLNFIGMANIAGKKVQENLNVRNRPG